MLDRERQQLFLGSDRREEEKEMLGMGREDGFVRVQAACAIAHTANLPSTHMHSSPP